jgi:hypothetical protein
LATLGICGARTKRGATCKRPATANGHCHLHGGPTGRRNCVRCGRSFYAKPSRPEIKYCSLTCRRTPRVAVTCAICGRIFECAPSRATKRFSCSHECRHRLQGLRMRAYEFKAVVSKSGCKKRAQVRLPQPCAICGYTRTECDVCHVIPSRESDCHELWNLIRLCPNHHRLFDAGKLEQHPFIINAREKAWRHIHALNAE